MLTLQPSLRYAWKFVLLFWLAGLVGSDLNLRNWQGVTSLPRGWLHAGLEVEALESPVEVGH